MLSFLKLHWAKFPAELLSSLISQGITVDCLAASSSAALKNLQCPAPVIQRLQKFEASLVDDDLRWLQEDYHHLVTIVDDDYPILLKEIERTNVNICKQVDEPEICWSGSGEDKFSERQTARMLIGSDFEKSIHKKNTYGVTTFNSLIEKSKNLNNCSLVLDLSDVFENTSDSVYFDQVHTNNLGNKIIAERIYRELIDNKII